MKFRFLIPVLLTATLFAQQISAPSTNGGVTADISDRAARLMGHVTVDTAPTTAVTGTFWQATQPVSGTFWQATQPVSGTVSATQGTSPWVDDPSDRSARLLGHVTVDTAPAITGAVTATEQSNLPTGQNGVIPVMVMAGPPPLSTAISNNPLLYRSAMRTYCYQNLAGCGPLK